MEEKSEIEKKSNTNQRLKYERERRGWSLGYVATLIDCPDPHTIGRWERGISFPSPRYRHALCELFGKDAEELGLLKREQELISEPLQQPIAAIGRELHEASYVPRSETCFFFNVKLPCADDLYGRVVEREILFNRTYHKSSTSIVGSRRIGKTWLLEYLMLEARTQLGSRFRVGYLDTMMASCSTVAGFTAKAAKELGFPISTERASQGLAVLEEAVENLRSRGQYSVLCIDEFDGFAGKQEFDLDFFASLRAMTQLGLILVIASKRPLIDIVGDYGNTSGFFNIFEQLTLEPFDNDEAEEFTRTKGTLAGFNDQEQEALMKYGQSEPQQWPPIRLQLVGKMLMDDKALRARDGSSRYRPDDPNYWQKFEQRLEEKYRGVVR